MNRPRNVRPIASTGGQCVERIDAVTCRPEVRPQWKRPAWLINVVLAGAGLGVSAAGVLTTAEWTGLLPYLGSAMFLVGSSGGIASGSGMGSVVRLIAGAPERRVRLTEVSHSLEHRLAEVAEPISGPQRVSFAVAEGCYVAAAEWSDDVTNSYIWYLLCRTIAEAKELAARDDPARATLTAEQLRAVIRSLHFSSRVPSEIIARFLDIDVETVRASLPAASAS